MRERAGLAVAFGCLVLVVFRALSPDFYASYDWMSLLLTFLAALGILLPAWLPEKRSAAEQTPAPARPDFAWEGLRLRADALSWTLPSGGLYDGLTALAADNPYAAVCGGYATLSLLLTQAGESQTAAGAITVLEAKDALSAEEAAVLTALLTLLDAYTQIGAQQAEAPCNQGLLGLTLCAMGRVEAVMP